MNIETPVNQPPSAYKLNHDIILDFVLSAAFYPNFFYRPYNPEREKEAHRFEKEL